MRRLLPFLLLLAACGGSGVTDTTISTTTTMLPPATSVPTATTAGPPVECPPAPYELASLPLGVGESSLEPEEIEPDVWTSVGGTNSTFWARSDGTVAIALVRGTLPAVDWPGEKGEVDIDGSAAVAGPHPDGTWVVGWFEQPGERCDLYSMIFYTPVAPADVEETLAGMNRVGG